MGVAAMTHMDVCSGIGGFALAARWAGMNTVQFVEIDPFCQAVLRKNFPGIPIHGDAITFDAEPFRGGVDLLTAGFPCQPHSVAGKKKGRDDHRNLWPCIIRIIRDCQPVVCLLENVYNLANTMLDEVLGDLAGAGYETEVYCVAAEDVGAPHRRERLWIVAHAGHGAGQAVGPGNGRRDAPARWNQVAGAIDFKRDDVADASQGRVRQRRQRQPFVGQPDSAAMADTDRSGRAERGGRQPGDAEPASPECGRETVADAEGFSQRAGLCAGEPAGERGAGLRNGGCDVADTHDDPAFRPEQSRANGPQLCGAPAGGFGVFPPSRTDYRSWAAVASVDPAKMPCVERPLRRGANELPGRLDGVTGSIRNHRLKSLGNAIVPQVAYLFISAIAESLT